MRGNFKFLRTTIAGGILFLVPLVVIIVVCGKALTVMHKIVAPLAALLPFQSLGGLDVRKVLAIALLVLTCFLAGLVARGVTAKRLVKWLETSVLSNLPGYQFIKGIGEGVLGAEDKHPYEVVLVGTEDCWQLGFLIERIEAGLFAVFVPGTPNPRSGGLFFMSERRIRPAGITAQSAMKCLHRVGVGAGTLLKNKPSAPGEEANPSRNPPK